MSIIAIIIYLCYILGMKTKQNSNNKIRLIREILGLRRSKFAKLLNVTHTAIYIWEKSKNWQIPSADHIPQLKEFARLAIFELDKQQKDLDKKRQALAGIEEFFDSLHKEVKHD